MSSGNVIDISHRFNQKSVAQPQQAVEISKKHTIEKYKDAVFKQFKKVVQSDISRLFLLEMYRNSSNAQAIECFYRELHDFRDMRSLSPSYFHPDDAINPLVELIAKGQASVDLVTSAFEKFEALTAAKMIGYHEHFFLDKFLQASAENTCAEIGMFKIWTRTMEGQGIIMGARQEARSADSIALADKVAAKFIEKYIRTQFSDIYDRTLENIHKANRRPEISHSETLRRSLLRLVPKPENR